MNHFCGLAGFDPTQGDCCPRCDWNAKAGYVCRWCECIIDAEGKDAEGNTSCPRVGKHERRSDHGWESAKLFQDKTDVWERGNQPQYVKSMTMAEEVAKITSKAPGVAADTMMGCYCGGDATKIPLPIDWDGWQRIADYNNRLTADLRRQLEQAQRMVRIAENAFKLQEAVNIPGKTGELNCLQIAKAWLALEKRAEAAEQKLAAAQDDLNAAAEQNVKLTTENGKLAGTLQRIAETVSRCPTVTNLQTACVEDHSIIWMAIRDQQDAFRDTVNRLTKSAALPSEEAIAEVFAAFIVGDKHCLEPRASIRAARAVLAMLKGDHIVESTEGIGKRMGKEGEAYGKRRGEAVKTVSQVKKVLPVKRNRLAILRAESGLGVRELARYAGISPATASRVESGKSPDIRTALHLAKFFETSVEDLFNEFF